MYASTQRRQLLSSWFFRCCGRTSSVVIVLGWLYAVIAESIRTGPPVVENYLQFVPLAIVFAGYAIGWRKELLGGITVLFGTLASIWLDIRILDAAPLVGMLCFAAPGVFYLLAHYFHAINANAKRQEWQP